MVIVLKLKTVLHLYVIIRVNDTVDCRRSWKIRAGRRFTRPAPNRRWQGRYRGGVMASDDRGWPLSAPFFGGGGGSPDGQGVERGCARNKGEREKGI